MSFLKDPDAYTRGSGAIASSDYKNPRRAAERRARLARTAQIDRARAGYTYGSRGGIGAVDSAKLGVTRAPTLVQGGNVESPNAPQVGSGQTSFQMPPTMGAGTGGSTFVPQTFYQPAPTTRPMVEAGTGQRTWVDPGPAPAPSPGGMPVPNGLPPAPTAQSVPVRCADGNLYIWAPGTPSPCAPVQPASIVGLSSSAKKWLLIAAVIGGGAYLYSRNKRGA